MEYRAIHKHAPMSSRKIRVFADLIRGKQVSEAIALLNCYPNRGARLVEAVLISAKANAEDRHVMHVDELCVLDVRVDASAFSKRWRPKARGSSTVYLKRTSHITVIVG
ncbi:MAG: 50S ribosomal protein L22 [Thermoguttaceae bacterium]